MKVWWTVVRTDGYGKYRSEWVQARSAENAEKTTTALTNGGYCYCVAVFKGRHRDRLEYLKDVQRHRKED
jgi:hypothetical protein